MRKVRKNFYITSWIVSLSLILFIELMAWYGGWERGWSLWSAFNGLFVLPLLIYQGIVFLIFLHILWRSIEGNDSPISPRKAVGFMFIPLFNIYWIFRVVGGYASSFNSYIKRYSISVPPLSERPFQAFSIYIVTAGIMLNVFQVFERSINSRPLVTGGLFVISAVTGLVIGYFFIAEACRGVNSIAGVDRKEPENNITASQEHEDICPGCQARVLADVRFCSNCGMNLEKAKPQVQQVFCPESGAEKNLDVGLEESPAAGDSCRCLGTATPELIIPTGFNAEQRFGADKELVNYVLEAEGINFKTINICMAVGIFILGWLVLIVYSFLGKLYRGLIFFVPVFILSRFALGSIPVLLLVLAIWAIAWVDAGRILRKYQDAARRRLDEINLQPAPEVDFLLEKGILLQKVLCQRFEALESIKRALTMPGGDPVLWALAGIELTKQGAFGEADTAFSRSNGAQGGRAYRNRLRSYKKKVGKKLGIASSC